MSCHHKFQSYLNLQRLGFDPETLIVGTFNPSWPASNKAAWFCGRTDTNYFWDVLPRLYGSHTLLSASPAEWKQFCQDKKIALTDLISTIDDAMPDNREHQKMLGGFSDSAIIHNFDDFEFVNIVQLLRQHPTIKNVYLTRGVTEPFWRYLWNPVAHYCNHNNIHERILMAPDIAATYQFEAHNAQNPSNRSDSLQDYILARWQQEWHFK